MSKTRWLQVKDLFDRAAGLAPVEQAAFIRAACPNEPEVADEVLSLLQHHRPGQSFLEPPDSRSVARAFEQLEIQPKVGRCLGAYRLQRLIASGGMAHVFLGERADGQFERQVAIKVIRRSLDSPELRRRFQTEQQALAALDHVHIAKLLDGGVTDDGLSYLVMELVEGLPIDEYCLRSSLTLAARLELFRQVGSAVHYAHQRLVIHRDLKPGNILVTSAGLPKLLDFGVAKLINEETQAEHASAPSVPFFTPEFASPEQIRGEPITTASDVYALGVVLFHLLTGRLPYATATDATHALARAVCEQPAIPASRAAALAPAPFARWSKRLAGDVDTIIAMALRKEPDRRYASVEQFSEDIRRHLAGLPVIARKDTFTYRAKKFVGRNKLGVLGAAAIGLAIVAVTVGTSVALVRVRQAQHRAQLMNDFLQDMLAQMDVDEVGRDLTLRDVLDRASARADDAIAAYPDVLAGVHSTIGRAYLGQRLMDDARVHLDKALQLNRRVYGDSVQVADSLHNLSVFHHFAGEDRRAIELCRAALALRRRHAADDARTAALIADLGVMLKSAGDQGPAEQFTREGLALRRALLPADHPDIASSLNNLGVLLRTQGRLAEAQPVLEEALELLRRVHGNEHVEVANALGNLANLLHATGQLAPAEQSLREALRISRALLPATHPRIAITANNLAKVLESKGEFDEAEQLFREGIAVNREQFGAGHPKTATMLHNLSQLLVRQDRFAEALDACTAGLQARRDALGAEHEHVAVSLDGLGNIQLRMGDAVTARRTLTEALDMRLRLLSPDHPDWVSSYDHLAQAHAALGEWATAQRFAEQAVSHAQQLGGLEHPLTARCMSLLGEIEAEVGAVAVGRAHLESALRTQRASLAEGHPDMVTTLQRLTQVCRAAGDCLGAEDYRTQLRLIQPRTSVAEDVREALHRPCP